MVWSTTQEEMWVCRHYGAIKEKGIPMGRPFECVLSSKELFFLGGGFLVGLEEGLLWYAHEHLPCHHHLAGGRVTDLNHIYTCRQDVISHRTAHDVVNADGLAFSTLDNDSAVADIHINIV